MLAAFFTGMALGVCLGVFTMSGISRHQESINGDIDRRLNDLEQERTRRRWEFYGAHEEN